MAADLWIAQVREKCNADRSLRHSPGYHRIDHTTPLMAFREKIT